MSDVVGSGSAAPASPVKSVHFPISHGLEILLRPEATDLDGKDVQAQRKWLFESDPGRCWVDIYTARSNLVRGSEPSLPSVSGEDTDIEYLGRCDIPFQRIRNMQDHKNAVQLAISNTANQTSSPHLQPTLFYMIRQKHSWSRLLTSQELLALAIGTLHTGNPALTNIMAFGFKYEDLDIGGPPFWYKPPVTRDSDYFARKKHDYNCGYTLKYVELNRKEEAERPWSERQSGILFCGDRQTWALVSPSTRMQIRMAEYCESLGPGEACNTFVLHLLFIGAAVSNWRPYLAYMTHETNAQINRAIATNQDTGEDLGGTFDLLTTTDRQRFRLIEDRVSDMFAMLDATSNVLTSLQEKYHVLFLGQSEVSIAATRDDPLAFSFQEKIREVIFLRRQLQALNERVKSGVQLLSSLLDLKNGQSLRKLAEESKQENAVMKSLSEKATADASAVKVITIITLVYLPTSVVTNFFSTTFVNSQPGSGGTYVTVADNWWVLVAVAAPLTLVTCVLWLLLQNRRKCMEMSEAITKHMTGKIAQRWPTYKAEKLAPDEEQRSTC